jgi:hypothetical protein
VFSLCIFGVSGADALHFGAAAGDDVAAFWCCTAWRLGQAHAVLEGNYARGEAWVCIVPGTRALPSKARSPDPITMPYGAWTRQKFPRIQTANCKLQTANCKLQPKCALIDLPSANGLRCGDWVRRPGFGVEGARQQALRGLCLSPPRVIPLQNRMRLTQSPRRASAVLCSAVQCSAVQCSAVQCSPVRRTLHCAEAVSSTPQDLLTHHFESHSAGCVSAACDLSLPPA